MTLRTLGSLDLLDEEAGEVTAVLSQPKRLAILVYLALARPRGFHRRDSVTAVFWPESDDTHARNALSQSLTHLRRNLPEGLIVTRGTEEIGLQQELIQADVALFEDSVSSGRWREALDLYRGDFLHGFHVGDAVEFEDWVAWERDRLREEAATAAWGLARAQVAEGALVEAERTAQRALALVWSEESPVLEFVQALASAGDRAGALRLYEKFRTRLWEALGVDPSQPLLDLVTAIRSGEVESPGGPGSGWSGEAGSAGPTGLKAVVGPSPGGDEVSASGSDDPQQPAWDDSRSDLPTAPTSPKTVRGSRWSLRARVAVAFVAVFVCASSVVGLRLWTRSRAGPLPSDRPFTVVADVGGNADERAREAVLFLIRNGLDMAHVVRTVPEAQVGRVLELMDRGDDSHCDPATAREVAVRLGVTSFVVPRLDQVDDQYVLALRVEDVSDGMVLAYAGGSAARGGPVVGMVDEVVRDLRRGLGDSRAALASTQPLPTVLTASLDALERYRLARNLNASGESRAAVSLLREAVALDPEFAMAWQLMAAIYGNFLNEPDSAALAAEQVQLHVDRLSDARRADLALHRRMSQDVALWDLGLREAEEAMRRNPEYLGNYAEYTAMEAGLPDSALAMRFALESRRREEALQLDATGPSVTNCYLNTHYLAVALDRIVEWYFLLDSLGVGLPADCAREAELFEALAAGAWSEAEQMLVTNPDGWRWPAAVETVSRQLRPLRGEIHAAHRMPPPENAEKKTEGRGQWSAISHLLLEVFYGLDPEGAPELTFRGTGLPRDLDDRGREAVEAYVVYGVREALVGDTTEGRRVLRRLEAMRNTSTSRTFESAFDSWFVLMEVGPAFRRGDWSSVIGGLEPLADRIHDPGRGFMAGDAYLVWWMLAEAYAQTGRQESALACLEAIVRRLRARVQDWTLQGFVHPAARFKLAGLYAEAEAWGKAREHYQVFLDTFTNPDPDFTWMVDEARARITLMETMARAYPNR